MKFTLAWLKDFLDTDASLEQITTTLTMLGLEVEEVIDRSAQLNDFEVAQILEASPHPDADKLRVCKVQTATEVLQIVCGAANARAGIKVVLAKVGALIPNGDFKIKQSKIRGVDSCGMLCSAQELNIKGDSAGIIELAESAVIGDKIAAYFGLDDPVIHINVTPNRADGLAVYGIARDLAAAGVGKLRDWKEKPSWRGALATKQSDEIARNDVPLFTTCEIKNIKNTESPKWLKCYLENIGIASISPVVDVTNYISYTFGQPMHAYDAAKLKGDLVVEVLKSPTKFAALNDKEYELIAGDLVIRDDENIHCLAGIIGGADSACSPKTSRIILEAACFDSKYVARTGRRLMIDTDSRYRFERNVDLEFTTKALDYAADMILEICGGEVLSAKVSGSTKLPIRIIDFPREFLESRAGFSLKNDEIVNILTKLGFSCNLEGNNIKIQIPSWRYDVSIKEDIVEEIVRIHGYDKIPMIQLPNMIAGKIIANNQRRNMDLKRLLASHGYTEVVSWSFMDSKNAAFFTEIKDELTLQNPISSDLNYMRPSILPNLLKIACNNINRSYKDLSFFELGPIFQDANNILPIKSLAAIRIGLSTPKNSYTQSQNFDVFDIKSDLEVVFASVGLELDKCQLGSEVPSYYHPGRSSAIMLGKNILGYFGQIHPKIAKISDIDQDIMAFEIDISKLPATKEKFGKKPEYKVSDYQMITRDYAFIVDDFQKIGEVLSFIKNVDKNLIKNVSLFDIYQGDKITKGKKSIAISVTIQDDNKTLTEEEITNISKLIVDGAGSKFGAVLRD
jgi:phenylalanyl-tRNA synthetase beta chain